MNMHVKLEPREEWENYMWFWGHMNCADSEAKHVGWSMDIMHVDITPNPYICIIACIAECNLVNENT